MDTVPSLPLSPLSWWVWRDEAGEEEKWLWLLPLRHIHTSAAESCPPLPSSFSTSFFLPSLLPSEHPICTLLDPPPSICVSYLHLLITLSAPPHC